MPGGSSGGVKPATNGETHPAPGREDAYEMAQQREYDLELATLEPSFVESPHLPQELSDIEKGGATIVIEEPRPVAIWKKGIASYFHRMKGGVDIRGPVPPWHQILVSFIGAFLGILSVSALNQWVSPEIDLPLLVGSFGASAVLIFAVPESKLAQPWNFVGGQVLSAIIGTVVRLIIHVEWIAEPVGMSLALVGMLLTKSTHPPGGATALIACMQTDLPKWAGFSYVLTVLWGSVVMLIVALLVNNLHPKRTYPTYW